MTNRFNPLARLALCLALCVVGRPALALGAAFRAAFSVKRFFSSSGNSLYCSHFSLISCFCTGGAVFRFLYWVRAWVRCSGVRLAQSCMRRWMRACSSGFITG